ncbi:MAG: 50S ribosomal protein L22 [Candidatus Omnitrophica bacterium CG11_big_fil_rev_8_21_14_0_20_64_10]|nr:MAG: 50S ribosomal protein L22 [Candidatus Omnitrophica bacterium CG11_big_fil_rev_8_21_14_0_20_64_10]
MIAKAKGRYLRTTPRKIREVIRLLRGMDVLTAQATLKHLPKRAGEPIGKVLNSAIHNATREGTVQPEQLVISKIWADGGPIMRRYKAAPMGRAVPIQKKTTHLSLELDIKK